MSTGLRIATDLPTIFDQIQIQLGTVVDPARVFWSLADDEVLQSYPIDDQFIVLAPANFPADQGLMTGGGNTTLMFDGTLSLSLWNRLGTDLATMDNDQLKDLTNGILGKFRQVLAALNMFDPVDPAGSGGLLLEEPMRIVGFETRPRRTCQSHVKLSSYWECKYQQVLP